MAQTATASEDTAEISIVPLDTWHRTRGAKMVPFAGYAMPLHYSAGILKEHLHTRAAAGLFDVSHMGQVRLRGPGALAFAESLVCGALMALRPGKLKYSLLMNDQGGAQDDLILGPLTGPDDVWIVINAGCKNSDIAYLRAHLPPSITLEVLPRALLALQGPKAADMLATIEPEATKLSFMEIGIFGARIISRTGYTGEDGFEISVAEKDAAALADALCAHPDVLPIGLGARDSLRLEAGLCLYGHELDATTSPVEADLVWTLSKKRALSGAFPGATRVQKELESGSARMRVGLKPTGRAPVREGAELLDDMGATIGRVTSGGFSPSLSAPIAMGYVPPAHAAPGTRVFAELRGRREELVVTPLPFVSTRYHKG